MRSAVCSPSERAFSKHGVLSPGEAQPAIWTSSATSSPAGAEEPGGGGAAVTTFTSLTVSKALAREQKESGTGPG